jgi:hypothetical protein
LGNIVFVETDECLNFATTMKSDLLPYLVRNRPEIVELRTETEISDQRDRKVFWKVIGVRDVPLKLVSKISKHQVDLDYMFTKS